MRKLLRSRNDRKLAGICGGLGEYFNIDPTMVRLLMVFAAVATGVIPLLLAYVVGLLIVPEE